MNPIRILCVDDHAFLVEGLEARFAQEPDLKIVGRLAQADDLVKAVMTLKPDIVLLDIEMPGRDAFEAAGVVSENCPASRVVVLSAFVRDHYISAARKAGAWGYFSKSDDSSAIIAGLRRVAKGEFVLSPRVVERCAPDSTVSSKHQSRLDLLTPREQDVLRLIGRGLPRERVAQSLSLSVKTVDGHRDRMMKKLNIHTTTELVRFAIREGLAEV